MDFRLDNFEKRSIRQKGRRYTRGAGECAYCAEGHHHRCRPKLDNELCTCNCGKSREFAQRVAAEMAKRPGVKQAAIVIELAPEIYGSNIGGDYFAPPDRRRTNPLDGQ